MPWSTIEEAKKHKKNMTDKQARQWLRIANSVRKRELAKGKSEKEADASAIKQANGAVMNTNESKEKYIVCKLKQTLDYEPKLTVHQEKAHLVVPVVMMVEGVHNGSQGPLLHEITELGKFPDSWNGIPVVIYHPTKDDEPVSANSPEIIDTRTVGRVYNTNVEGKKLKAEVWFDEDKLNTISETTLNDINDSKEIEVSLGMFTENEEKEGEYEGEEYVAIAHNHRPDHLAILPDQKGACSVEDGCGIGANEESTDELIGTICRKGYSVNQIGNHTDTGYREKMDAVYATLRGLDTNDSYNYLEEMYDDELIYSKSSKDGTKMYKQSYKFESGKIELIGEPVEVHKKVEYVLNQLNNNESKKEVKMPKGNDCPKCLEKINALIANEQSKFVETDREWLLTQEEATLDKLEPVIVEKEKVVEKTVEVNKLSPEDQAALAFGKRQMKERRDKLTKGILDNTEEGIWTEEVLNKMDEDTLEKVSKSIKKEEIVDYSLGGGGFSSNAEGEEALYPIGVEIETKK